MARRDASDLNGQEHMRMYRATDGEYGHDWFGCPTLLLTTTGRNSGEPRTTPLIYGRSADDYFVIASKGGSDRPPDWYLNLQQRSEAEVQILAERFRVRARDATATEKPEMWRELVSCWPDFDKYQESTEREIPVVVLARL
jgi:deazaflavin-dependent oxidoreductase (nitroreductase family)